MKLEFSRKMLEKQPNIKIFKIRPVGSELRHADGRAGGRTDRQTEMTKLFAIFRTRLKISKIVVLLLCAVM